MSELSPYKVLYDYSDAPTLRAFALSNKRVRYVQGPFGSGKSSACVIEIFKRAIEQKPGPDGIRRSRWAVVRNCYDDQTEVLTEKRGWQLFKDVLPGDKIASLENGEELVFVLPSMYYAAPYTGEMIGYKNTSMDFLVTPDHHLYASMINGRTKKMYGYKFHRAQDIYGMTHYRFKVSAEKYEGGTTEYSEDFFEFLGFWFADGSCGEYMYEGHNSPVRNFRITQKKHITYLEDLLRRNNIKYKRTSKTNDSECYDYCFKADPRLMDMFELFLRAGVQKNRAIPSELKCAPRMHLKAFLYGYAMGDGHIRTNKHATDKLYAISRQLADDLQELIVKIGGCARIKKQVQGVGFIYVVTILQSNQYKPQTQKKDGWYKQEYSGMVYCVEVPSHVILVRRANKIIWLSQTYSMLKDTTIRTVHDWFPPKLFGEYRITDHIYVINQIPGVQLEILFRALDRPDQVSNLLSLEVTGAWFNEAREIPKTIVDAMDGRIGRYPSVRDGGGGWYGMVLDSNPCDTDSWVYKTFEQNCPDTWEIFKQPSGLSVHAENLKHLPKNYYQNLAKGKDEMYVRVYVHGQYGYMITGKPVFASFKDNIHVAPRVLEPIKGQTVFIGMDFALQPSATLAQLTPTGQLLVLDELVSDGMGIKRFSETQLLPLLRRKYFGCNVVGFGDPSGTARAPTDESSCFDVLHSSEIGLSEIYPATTNALVPRIGAVEHFLNHMSFGEPSFVLSPNCKNLRKALNGAYHYEKDLKTRNGDEYKTTPVKNFASHIADSLQMLCLYVIENGTEDKARKAFFAQLKNKQHRPASSTVGY